MSNQVSKTRRGLIIYDENPFISVDMVKPRVKRITNRNGDMYVRGADDTTVAPAAGFWQTYEVDSAQFVKLYVKGVKALAELSGAGTKVFEILYVEMQKHKDKDRVLLSYAELDGKINLSQATFTRGVRELIDKGFIAPSRVVGFFWINPDFLWNGDRLTFVQEYRRVSDKRAKQQIPGQLEMTLLQELTKDNNEVSE